MIMVNSVGIPYTLGQCFGRKVGGLKILIVLLFGNFPCLQNLELFFG